jgi:hypothetical protein
MSKSNMTDGHSDAFTAAALITLVVGSLAFWLMSMPT